MSEVPHTHFSMLNEMTFNVIAPLEMNGYTLPQEMVPDISTGRMFSKWLRDSKGMDTSDESIFPSYCHRYADGRNVQARLYPMSVLEDFRKYLHEDWIPTKMVEYFRKKDIPALEYIAKAFPKLFGAQATGRKPAALQ